MYRSDRKFASAYGNDFKSRFNPQVWLDDDFYQKDGNERHANIEQRKPDLDKVEGVNYDTDGSDFEELNPYNAIKPSQTQGIDMKRRYSNPNIYKHKKPSVRYKDYMERGCNEDLATKNYSLDSIIGKLDTYNDNLQKYHRRDEMDLDAKVSIPGAKSNNKREKENNYRSMPHMNGSKPRDVDMENYLCYGSGPSRGAKSLGYPNPAEHYFQYISDDIQRPEHSVFERGMPSRLRNKDTARAYKTRDIM
jgi:hypothetical protein